MLCYLTETTASTTLSTTESPTTLSPTTTTRTTEATTPSITETDPVGRAYSARGPASMICGEMEEEKNVTVTKRNKGSEGGNNPGINFSLWLCELHLLYRATKNGRWYARPLLGPKSNFPVEI